MKNGVSQWFTLVKRDTGWAVAGMFDSSRDAIQEAKSQVIDNVATAITVKREVIVSRTASTDEPREG